MVARPLKRAHHYVLSRHEQRTAVSFLKPHRMNWLKNRRIISVKITQTVLAALFTCTFSLPSATADPRPNIVFIMSDDHAVSAVSAYGNSVMETPNIDRIADNGVRFDRAYTQSPFCGPSRASFYTGRYVRSHGATWNGFPLRVGEQTGCA